VKHPYVRNFLTHSEVIDSKLISVKGFYH
jgi:hypothetical protein